MLKEAGLVDESDVKVRAATYVTPPRPPPTSALASAATSAPTSPRSQGVPRPLRLGRQERRRQAQSGRHHSGLRGEEPRLLHQGARRPASPARPRALRARCARRPAMGRRPEPLLTRVPCAAAFASPEAPPHTHRHAARLGCAGLAPRPATRQLGLEAGGRGPSIPGWRCRGPPRPPGGSNIPGRAEAVQSAASAAWRLVARLQPPRRCGLRRLPPRRSGAQA